MSIEKRKRVILFYNPNSGNGLFKNNLDLIIERFQSKDFQVVPIRAAKGFAIEQVLQEIEVEDYRQIIVAGGDGTINICVNSMLKNNIDLPLAIFPVGTANDFAYYFDLPNDIESMVDVAMGEHTTYADIGVCNDKYFVNVAALGTLVDVSQKTDPNLKNTLGILSYYLKGLTEIGNLKPLKVTLHTDKKTYREKMYFMVVMNGISAGGFKRISPHSEVNDGKLDVVLFKEMPFIELGPLLLNIIQGRHPKHRNVLYLQTETLTVESQEEISTDIDGEHGDELPLKFSVLHNRLKIFTEGGA